MATIQSMRAAAPDEDRDEEDDDRHDEVAAVEARILEERGDAEERRVRIRDLHVAPEEERAGLRLPDADRREQRSECDECDQQRSREPVGQRAPHERRKSGCEREYEERERDATRALVPRPQKRRCRQRHEGSERHGEEEWGRRRSLAAEDPVRERDDRSGDHEIQREEQERLLVTELDGNAEGSDREQRHRHRRRITREHDGGSDGGCRSDPDERNPSRISEEQLDLVVTDERPAKAARRRAEQRKPDEREDAASRDQDAYGTERAEQRCDLRELHVLHGGRRYATSD